MASTQQNAKLCRRLVVGVAPRTSTFGRLHDALSRLRPATLPHPVKVEGVAPRAARSAANARCVLMHASAIDAEIAPLSARKHRLLSSVTRGTCGGCTTCRGRGRRSATRCRRRSRRGRRRRSRGGLGSSSSRSRRLGLCGRGRVFTAKGNDAEEHDARIQASEHNAIISLPKCWNHKPRRAWAARADAGIQWSRVSRFLRAQGNF
jgi:hypothetical protein